MKMNEKILLLRKREGLSQEELAEKLDISRQSVYKWENGMSTPELDKIKALASLFNVSFDYLMNDEIEALPTEGSAQKKVLQRNVFTTNNVLTKDQVDIDNGFLPEKGKAPCADEDSQLKRNIEHAKAALNELGITDLMQIHPNSATFFFCDDKNKTCGFFFAGMIQFVCPIENVLEFSFSGGGQKLENQVTPTLMSGDIHGVSASTDYDFKATLSYSDNDEAKLYELEFTAAYKHQGLLVLRQKITPAMLNTYKVNCMNTLTANLQKLQAKLALLSNTGAKILNGQIAVEELDFSAYETKNKSLEEFYSKYIKDIGDAMDQYSAQYSKGGSTPTCGMIVAGFLLAVIGIIALIVAL